MRLATIAAVTLTLLLSAAVDAQWLKYPTPAFRVCLTARPICLRLPRAPPTASPTSPGCSGRPSTIGISRVVPKK
jgi:hypothetical protein